MPTAQDTLRRIAERLIRIDTSERYRFGITLVRVFNPIIIGANHLFHDLMGSGARTAVVSAIVLGGIAQLVGEGIRLGRVPFFRNVNRLILERGSGILRDRDRMIRNVALRCETVEVLLREIGRDTKKPREQRVHTCTRVIGKRFADEFAEKVAGSWDGEKRTPEGLLRAMCQYDSTSGMGRFEIESFSEVGPEITYRVRNAFSREFLPGYLAGICEGVTGRRYEADVLAAEDEAGVTIAHLRPA